MLCLLILGNMIFENSSEFSNLNGFSLVETLFYSREVFFFTPFIIHVIKRFDRVKKKIDRVVSIKILNSNSKIQNYGNIYSIIQIRSKFDKF